MISANEQICGLEVKCYILRFKNEYEGVSKRFRTESIKKYVLTTMNTY